MTEARTEQSSESHDFPPVGKVTYRLQKDWLNHSDACYIERVEVIAHCKNRADARDWMLNNHVEPKGKQ